jgi:hypothetical protein
MKPPENRSRNKSIKGDIAAASQENAKGAEGCHSADEQIFGNFQIERTSFPSIGSTPELTTPRKARDIGFDAYIKHDVLKGSGFSTKLLKLDMVRVANAYPSPSEALNSCRGNRRLHRSVQTVGVVGLPPPQLQELHFAAENMKRHWQLDSRRPGGSSSGSGSGSGGGGSAGGSASGPGDKSERVEATRKGVHALSAR